MTMVRNVNTKKVDSNSPSEIITHYQNKISTLTQASEIRKVQKEIEESVYGLLKSEKYVPLFMDYSDIFKSLQEYLKSNQKASDIQTWIKNNESTFTKEISTDHQTFLFKLGKFYLDLEKKLPAKREVTKKASAIPAQPQSGSTFISKPKMNALTIINSATPTTGLQNEKIKKEIDNLQKVSDVTDIQRSLKDKALQGLEAAEAKDHSQNNSKKHWNTIVQKTGNEPLINDASAFPSSFEENDKKFIIQLAQLYNHCNAKIAQLQQNKDQAFQDKLVALLKKEPKDENDLNNLYVQVTDPRITEKFLRKTFEELKLDESLLTSLLNKKGIRASAVTSATEKQKYFFASLSDAKSTGDEYKTFVKNQLNNFIDKILKDECLDYLDSPKYRNNWLFGSCARKPSIHTPRVKTLYETLTKTKNTPVQSLQQATTQIAEVAQAIAIYRENLFNQCSFQNLRDLNIFLNNTFPDQYASFDMPHDAKADKRKEIYPKLSDMRTNLISVITKYVDPRSCTQQQNVMPASKLTT